MSPEQGFGNTDEPSTEELQRRFEKIHEQTEHGEHEGAPDPATGDNYERQGRATRRS